MWEVKGSFTDSAFAKKPIVAGRFWGGDLQLIEVEWAGFRALNTKGQPIASMKTPSTGGVAALRQRGGSDLLAVRTDGRLSAYRLSR